LPNDYLMNARKDGLSIEAHSQERPAAKHQGRLAMVTTTQAAFAAKKTVWAGWIISSLVGVFLLVDCVVKVLALAPAVEATTQLGYPAHLIVGIDVIEAICLGTYALAHTAPLGAILLTGYLGGAVASQVRAGSDPFQVIFPIIMGALVWGGLLLRDRRLRTHVLVSR